MLHKDRGGFGYQQGPMTGISGRLPGGGQPPPGYGGAGLATRPGGRAPGSSFGLESGSMSGIAGRLKSGAGDVVRWAGENPEIASSLAGGAASMYGAYQQGKAEDRDQKFAEQRWREEQEREDERLRNRAKTYDRILDRRRGY